jgi:hypothetical protein
LKLKDGTVYERTLAKWTPAKETALSRALETELALNKKRSPDRATRLAARSTTFKDSEMALANRSPDREKRLAARSTQFNES